MSLPRPLQDPTLLELMCALDQQHAALGRGGRGKGSWTLTVHYPEDGCPALARLQTSLDIALDRTAVEGVTSPRK